MLKSFDFGPKKKMENCSGIFSRKVSSSDEFQEEHSNTRISRLFKMKTETTMKAI